MVNYTADKVQVRICADCVAVGVEMGKPVELVGQKVESEECEEEWRERADKDQERGKGVVDQSTAFPGADNADNITKDKADNECCAAEQQGPDEAVTDYGGD